MPFCMAAAHSWFWLRALKVNSSRSCQTPGSAPDSLSGVCHFFARFFFKVDLIRQTPHNPSAGIQTQAPHSICFAPLSMTRLTVAPGCFTMPSALSVCQVFTRRLLSGLFSFLCLELFHWHERSTASLCCGPRERLSREVCCFGVLKKIQKIV